MPDTFVFLIWKIILIVIAIYSIILFLIIHATKKRCKDNPDEKESFMGTLIKNIFILIIIIVIGSLIASLSIQSPIGNQQIFKKLNKKSGNNFAKFPGSKKGLAGLLGKVKQKLPIKIPKELTGQLGKSKLPKELTGSLGKSKLPKGLATTLRTKIAETKF